VAILSLEAAVRYVKAQMPAPDISGIAIVRSVWKSPAMRSRRAF